MIAVDTFIRLNGKTAIKGLEDFEDEERPIQRRIALSTRGYVDLYEPEKEKDNKGKHSGSR